MEKLKSEMIKEQMNALEDHRKQLRDNEGVFLKVSGISESIEQYRTEIARLESGHEAKKEELAEIKAQKSDAVKNTLVLVQDRITELLPEGKGVVRIEDDGSFFVGWEFPDKNPIPYDGLSGGQKVVFGRALSKALMGDAENIILVYEAAEVDPPNLISMLERIVTVTNENTQVIVNTWFAPEEIPAGWNLIDFAGK